MAEMVDRGALALCNISVSTHGDANIFSLSALDPEAQRQFRLMAKTVIESMRVPTIAMSNAYIAGVKKHGWMCEEVWAAMIDEALK